MTDISGLEPVATFCGNCGCPQLFVDPNAPAEQRIVLTDDFGQRVQMSAGQFSSLVNDAKAGKLDGIAAPYGRANGDSTRAAALPHEPEEKAYLEDPASRRRTFSAALQQFEEQMKAAQGLDAGPLPAPQVDRRPGHRQVP
jgi:hypothetical protein